MDDSSKLDAEWGVYADLLSGRCRTVYVYGPPGVGKSYLPLVHPTLNGAPARAVTLTPETPASELRGHYLPVNGGFKWHDGPALAAMREGGRLVINEVSHASDDVLAILYAIMEGVGTSRLTLPTGETVKAQACLQVILTDNAGPERLPAALRDRVEAFLPLRRPHPDALALLPEELREPACSAIALPTERATGFRAWLSFASLRQTYPELIAARLAFGLEAGGGIADALAASRINRV